MAELEKKLDKAIKQFCAKGDRLAEQGKYSKAIATYAKAWDRIPEPKHKWNAATWVLAAQGDAAFLGNDMIAARRFFDVALSIEANIGNPFLHLRRGQVLFEQGEDDNAANELIRAYALEGPELFKADHPKYIEFLATRADGIEY